MEISDTLLRLSWEMLVYCLELLWSLYGNSSVVWNFESSAIWWRSMSRVDTNPPTDSLSRSTTFLRSVTTPSLVSHRCLRVGGGAEGSRHSSYPGSFSTQSAGWFCSFGFSRCMEMILTVTLVHFRVVRTALSTCNGSRKEFAFYGNQTICRRFMC